VARKISAPVVRGVVAALADFTNDCNDGMQYPAQIICYRQNVYRQSICSNSDCPQAKASYGSTRLPPLLLYKHFGPSRMGSIE